MSPAPNVRNLRFCSATSWKPVIGNSLDQVFKVLRKMSQPPDFRQPRHLPDIHRSRATASDISKCDIRISHPRNTSRRSYANIGPLKAPRST
eukprot:1179463-Prorocentrum_minimum.AAC.2